MAIEAEEIEKRIKKEIPDAQIVINDFAGDKNHYSAHIISKSFVGKTRLEQHQMVYDTLKDCLGGTLHALALQTKTPDQK